MNNEQLWNRLEAFSLVNARENLRVFTKELGYSNAPFHKEWYALLQPVNDPAHFSPFSHHDQALKMLHLEGPRKHGKSECISINYPTWLIGLDPELHITLVSKTASQAEASLMAITSRIERDPKYQRIFGRLKPQRPELWNNTDIIINRKTISKFPTIHATGLYGPLTGGDNDLIIADDIIDQENITTRLQKEKANLWFHKVLLTTLFPWGACLVIGTRWSYDDLYNILLSSWTNRVYKAILNEAEISRGEPPRVLWPKVWDYKRLMARKKIIGLIWFNCQYQNDPTGMQGDLLKSEWLHPWTSDVNIKSLVLYGGVDPALGEGDKAGISTVGFDHALNQAYLINVWCEKLSYPLFLKKLVESHTLYNYSKIFVETNAFQKSLMYQEELQGLPLVASPTDTNKERRMISLSSHFQSERVLVNPLIDKRSEFWLEWVQFPRGEFDDALDCVEINVRNLLTSGPLHVDTIKRA